MELEIALVVSQILAFLVLLWIMKKFAWKPFLNILEERRKKIQDTFDSIEEQKKSVEQLAASYAEKLAHIEEKARQKMQEAAERGEQLAQQIQAEAQKQARALLEKARADIDHEVIRAQGQLKEDVVKLVIEATEKLIRQKIDPATDKALIAAFVEEAKLHEPL